MDGSKPVNWTHGNIPLVDWPVARLSDKIDDDEVRIILSACAMFPNPSVLEVGTYRGGTTENIACYLEYHGAGSIVTLDVNTRPRSMIDDQAGEVLPASRIGELIDERHIAAGRVHRILINPNDPVNVEEAYRVGARYHVVFLDGDHSYEGTREALALAERYLAPGGVILMHDCWWNTNPPLVMGPLRLLTQLSGIVLNRTHIGARRLHWAALAVREDRPCA